MITGGLKGMTLGFLKSIVYTWFKRYVHIALKLKKKVTCKVVTIERHINF